MPLKLSDIKPDVPKTLNNSPILFVEQKPYFDYDKTTGAKLGQKGYTYTGVLTGLRFEKISVKIENLSPLFPLDKVVLDNPEIRFVNLQLKLYSSKDGFGVSASADSVSLVEKKGV